MLTERALELSLIHISIIRDSVRVHQKLGTKAAVEMALGGIHPKSEIEEWFDYGGKPYRFRIVLDTTESRVAADYDEIIKTVDIYKRLTAHLDGLYYQGSITVVVMPKTEFWLYSVPMTGQLKDVYKRQIYGYGRLENRGYVRRYRGYYEPCSSFRGRFGRCMRYCNGCLNGFWVDVYKRQL